MKRLFAVATVLLASSAAHAQYTFHYGGHIILIDPDSGTVSIQRSHGHIHRKLGDARSEPRIAHEPASEQAMVAPPPPVRAPAEVANKPPTNEPIAPAAQAPVPRPQRVPTTSAAQQPATADITSAERAALHPALPTLTPAAAPTRQLQRAVIPKPAPQPAATPAPAVADPNSPIGLWLTQEKEGKVRIEQCGASLCGYSVDMKSNQDGEQVLINMKQGNGLIWRGRILDPNTGSTYDSTMALKGAGRLRVQGCAFNGMFCGGQTWTRAN